VKTDGSVERPSRERLQKSAEGGRAPPTDGPPKSVDESTTKHTQNPRRLSGRGELIAYREIEGYLCREKKNVQLWNERLVRGRERKRTKR